MTRPGAGPLSREERRRRTEGAILAAARGLFAEGGFERTTIRAVAAAAGVDPALVMQHYGSKEGLFAAAARCGDLGQEVLHADLPGMPAAVLADFFRFEGSEGRAGLIALLRNCLTHPEAARVMREQVLQDRAAAVADAITADDAALRAALVEACLVGLGICRYLLEVPVIAAASQEDLARLLEPALRALVDPPPG